MTMRKQLAVDNKVLLIRNVVVVVILRNSHFCRRAKVMDRPDQARITSGERRSGAGSALNLYRLDN
jgi:hypothetical protein